MLVVAVLIAGLAVLAARDVFQVAGANVAMLAHHAPQRTALMLQRTAEAGRAHRSYSIDQRWVPYDSVSPLLRRAVLVAEDDAFFSHDALDWNEIRESARRNLEAGHTVRGGSTITQQLAKNLFLGSERSIERKLKEVFLAMRLEQALSKRRIFELYLNEIEWGDGIFGAEAAAQRYFGVSATDLDARQAALLAAIIINPRRYSPLKPSGRVERRVRIIASRLHARGALDDQQYQLALGAAAEPSKAPSWFERIFGGGGNNGAGSAADTTAADSTLESEPEP
ncbi:MAG: monofunctional biosynthetic peptidoglycan transglycosylase [Candidatus Eiseniibacteriota bacterium]